MDNIEALGLRLGDGLSLDGYDLESGLFYLGQNRSSVAFADRVWLNDAESALRHLNCSSKNLFFDPIVMAGETRMAAYAKMRLLKFS
jgi:hypothetical protein